MKEHRDPGSSIAASAAEILPGLEIMDPLKLSGEDRLLVLLASAAHFDGRLSPGAWQAATKLLHDVFDAGDGGRSFSTVQARFHAALLLDPVPPSGFLHDKDLAMAMDMLPAAKAERLRRGIMDLCPAYGQLFSPLGTGNASETDTPSMSELPFWRRGTKPEESVPAEDRTERVVMENGLAVTQSKKPPFLTDALHKGITGIESLAKGATHPYHWAARYFGAMNVMRLFPLLDRKSGGTPVAACFKETAGAAEALERLALSAGDVELFQQAVDFGVLMREQPYTVVVAGEGKRGKSSLVNALLGKEVSPVRESVAATAAVAKFRWGEKFRGRARHLSGAERERLNSLMNGGQETGGDVFSQEQGDIGEGDWIEESARLSGLLVQAYPGGEGRSAYAEVELPSELLRGGLVLVDTPGLNAASDVQNYLAYQACLEADCLVFVMDARRPESASETELMRLVARMGRAAGVIGVVTGMDRLNEKSSRDLALGEARRVLAAAQEEGLTVLGLLDINAREAMAARCAALPRSGGAEFQRLRALITETHAAGSRPGPELVSRVRLKGEELAGTVRMQAPQLLQKELAALPDAQHDVFLASHKDRLHKVLEKCVDQAQAVARSAAVDIDAWRKEQDRSLDEWEETTVLRIMDAANRHADELGGTALFSAKKWKDFNESTIPEIARNSLNELLIERRSLQRDWNEKLRQFSGAMREISVLCLDAVIVEDKELTSVKELSLSRTQWLVQANDMLKKIGLVGSGMALHSIGGLGLGLGAALGGLHWWAMVPVALVGGLIWLLRRVGDPARCRRIFLDKKEGAIRSWTARQKKRLQEVLDQNFNDLTSAYRQAAEESLMPAICMLAEEEASISVYLKVLEKMRADAGKKAMEMQAQAQALTSSLEHLDSE